MTAVVEHEPTSAAALVAVLGSAHTVPTFEDLDRYLEVSIDEDVVVLGSSVELQAALRLSERMRISRPSLSVVLVRRRIDNSILTNALRSGVREVVEERDLAGLNAAVRRAAELSHALRQGHGEAGGPRRGARLLTVFSAKGGCGKTTFALNLATALHRRGDRVCLVDLDLAFGDVAISLQVQPQHTIADAVPLAETLDAGAAVSLLTVHSSGLSVLAAPMEPYLRDIIPAELVGRVLDVLSSEFDWIVVDTPPVFEDHVLQAFDRSELLVLLVTPDIPALKNLKLTLDTLNLLNYPQHVRRIVVNRSDARVGLSLRDIEHTLGTPLTARVPSSRDVPASINRGVALVLDDPRHPVSQAIQAFADEYASSVTTAADTKSHAKPTTPSRSRWRVRLP